MKTISLLSAVALSLTAMSANAGQIELASPLAGATLNAGDIDMSVYWTDVDAGYEVVATYLEADAKAPAQMTMVLTDGDAVTFSLPGRLDHSFKIARTGGAVTVDAIDNTTLFASK